MSCTLRRAVSAGHGHADDIHFLLFDSQLLFTGGPESWCQEERRRGGLEEKRHKNRLRWLLQRDHNGLTPLHWAARGGHKGAFEQLRSQLVRDLGLGNTGTCPWDNTGDGGDHLPEGEMTELVRFQFDNAAQTPAQLARLNGYTDLADVVEDAIADILNNYENRSESGFTASETKESLQRRFELPSAYSAAKTAAGVAGPLTAAAATLEDGAADDEPTAGAKGIWASKTFCGMFGDPYVHRLLYTR